MKKKTDLKERLVTRVIEEILQQVVQIGEEEIREKNDKRSKRLEIARLKQQELKERLVDRAIIIILEKVVEDVSWSREIEEEIGKDRETEKIRDSGRHILRKRKHNKMSKYKLGDRNLKGSETEKFVKNENIENKDERKIAKAGRRKKEIQKKVEKQETGGKETNKKLNKGGKPQLVEKHSRRKNTCESESKIIRKKESGAIKRRKKVTENLIEKRNLQERMKKWLKVGGQITLG